MADVLWNWSFFFISLITLIAILFLQEYKEHKKINFENFKKYTFAFWFLNILYILIGATISTLLGCLLAVQDPLQGIIYAGCWEGIFNNLISENKKVIK